MTEFRQWWLGLSWPLWTLSACKPFSPWCLVDDVAHWMFPITFGWSKIIGDTDVSHWPDHKPWICRRHEESVEKYHRKKYPEDFDD